jgi:hypothetical protein
MDLPFISKLSMKLCPNFATSVMFLDTIVFSALKPLLAQLRVQWPMNRLYKERKGVYLVDWDLSIRLLQQGFKNKILLWILLLLWISWQQLPRTLLWLLILLTVGLQWSLGENLLNAIVSIQKGSKSLKLL